jgi:hypothetical protein
MVNEDTLTLDLIMAIISSFSSLNLSIKPTSEAPQVASPQTNNIKYCCHFCTAGLGLWCLTPLSTIFQLYHGGQFYFALHIVKIMMLLKILNAFLD